MAVVGSIVKSLGGVVGGVLASAIGGKPKAQKQVLPLPTAQSRPVSAVSDALLSRRGGAANQRTGAAGVESSAGKKALLGQ